MNERLLTEREMHQAADAWEARRQAGENLAPANRSRTMLLAAQDAKTRAATLRQCGEWLDKVLYSSQYAGVRIATLELSVEALKRGEEPWEVKS